MEFFYFGITFFHFKKRIDISPRKQMLSFQMFKEEVSEEMAAIIRKDVSELNASDLGDKSGYRSNGKFVRMDRDVLSTITPNMHHVVKLNYPQFRFLNLLAMENKKYPAVKIQPIITLCGLSMTATNKF